MTKRKTALQSAIAYYKDQLDSYDNVQYPTLHQMTTIRFIQSVIKELKSKLPQEKQDLIEAHYKGQKECSNEFAMKSDAEAYFNQTFEI